VALAKHAAGSLAALDVSMSRGVTDAGVGSVIDACPQLRTVLVWGCSQLTGRLFDGHRRVAGDGTAARGGSAGSSGSSSSSSGGAAGGSGYYSSQAGGSSSSSSSSAAGGGDVPLRLYGRPGDSMPAPTFDDWLA
jgi:hypothetical protein